MSVEVSVDAAKKDLEKLLAVLPPGEAATLTGSEGEPLALLISMKSSQKRDTEKEWDAEWNSLPRRSIKPGRARKAP
jgi:antitoxin (DNA-binding transcriptional repressor) of toxin-antitoxin stability system